jgi:PEP-CTERM motif
LKSTSLFMLLFLLALGCVAAPAWADVVPVSNPSFEITNPLTTPCGTGCAFNVGPIPDWMMTGAGGSFQPNSAIFNLPLPDGSIIAYSNGGTISQTLSTSLAANTTYVLSVDVGFRLNGAVDATTYSLALYAGGMLLNSFSSSNDIIPIGTFADETVTFTSGASVTPGQKLSIVLTSGGQQADFDNVRLTESAVPEPASLSLLAIGCGLMFFVFRRR